MGTVSVALLWHLSVLVQSGCQAVFACQPTTDTCEQTVHLLVAISNSGENLNPLHLLSHIMVFSRDAGGGGGSDNENTGRNENVGNGTMENGEGLSSQFETSHSPSGDTATSSVTPTVASVTQGQGELGVFEVIERLRKLSINDGLTFPSFILSNPLLFDAILSHASPATLYRLSKTCRIAYDAVSSFIPRVFDINYALQRFLRDPLAFRSIQARTGTLISGSFALQFLARTEYAGADLDVYCHYEDREELGKWLVEREGYRFTPRPTQDPDFDVAVTQARTLPDNADPYRKLMGLSAVYTFVRPAERGGDEDAKVQIIVAYRNPMEVVLNFHSTIVMNVIAYDRAYALYPRATFEDCVGLFLRDLEESHVPIIQKYRERGWAIVHNWPAVDPLTTVPLDPAIVPLGSRWIGDRRTWCLPLSTMGVAPPAPQNAVSSARSTDPCFATTWKIVSRWRSARQVKETQFQVIDALMFRFKYVCVTGKTGKQIKRTMRKLQEIFVRPDWDLGHVEPQDEIFVDEELLRWFKMVLQVEQVWDA